MKMLKNPILFLHGALGSEEDLSPLMNLVKEQGFEAYSFNFSGHGKNTQTPKEFRIDHFAHELDGFIQENKIIDPVVFGHSMGGYVALYHKANFENSPLKMIFTYGTKFNWSEQSVAKELTMLNPESLIEKYPNYIEALSAKHGQGWKNLLRSTAHMIQNLEKLDGLTREDLADVDIPVVLILGDQDRMVTSEETHLTSTWFQQASVKKVSHSKHDIERTNIKELANIILENLQSLY